MKLVASICAVLLLLGALDALAEDAPPAAQHATGVPSAWCAPELEALADDVCHYRPSQPALAGHPHRESARTLVIFLHGLVQHGTDWQHAQQRGFARAADRFGFSVIMPRGRVGAMRRAAGMVAWPTSNESQARHEAAIVAEWVRARESLEARNGVPFERVYVMGFSNGAYYATTLALRGKLEVDGYALFAGGSGATYLRRTAKRAERRVPIFVGIAGKDDTAKKARQLVELLRAVRWPHKAETRRIGHAVADAHLEHALDYLERADR